MKKMLRRRLMNIFKPKENSKEVRTKKEVKIETDPYGWDYVQIGLFSKDYTWNEVPGKKVTLTNPLECEGKVSIPKLVSAWRESGHSEWEVLWSAWFVKAVQDAIASKSSEADISGIFNKDFGCRSGKTFSAEQTRQHILPWFNIESETNDELRVSLRLAS